MYNEDSLRDFINFYKDLVVSTTNPDMQEFYSQLIMWLEDYQDIKSKLGKGIPVEPGSLEIVESDEDTTLSDSLPELNDSDEYGVLRCGCCGSTDLYEVTMEGFDKDDVPFYLKEDTGECIFLLWVWQDVAVNVVMLCLLWKL